LEKLILNQNRIRTIPKPQDSEFKTLKAISISQNLIDNWLSITSFHLLPALDNLRCTGNPLTATLGSAVARYLLIAHIAKLTTLNGSEVVSSISILLFLFSYFCCKLGPKH
jgi:hypothetical protein